MTASILTKNDLGKTVSFTRENLTYTGRLTSLKVLDRIFLTIDSWRFVLTDDDIIVVS